MVENPRSEIYAVDDFCAGLDISENKKALKCENLKIISFACLSAF